MLFSKDFVSKCNASLSMSHIIAPAGPEPEEAP